MNTTTYINCFECDHEFEVEFFHGEWHADGMPGTVDGPDVWFDVAHVRGNGWECAGSAVLRDVFTTDAEAPDEDRYVPENIYHAATAADYDALDNYDPTARYSDL